MIFAYLFLHSLVPVTAPRQLGGVEEQYISIQAGNFAKQISYPLARQSIPAALQLIIVILVRLLLLHTSARVYHQSDDAMHGLLFSLTVGGCIFNGIVPYGPYRHLRIYFMPFEIQRSVFCGTAQNGNSVMGGSCGIEGYIYSRHRRLRL
ncbi:hypothetical protein JB92DRAFT_1307279 [Gautieria morchelliformis]|nr:hypothetical protein JB92DRAFT_1307279 [Gautieria morchelliformis]